MQKVISTILVIVGIIHLLPIVGVLGTERLLGLYGVSINDPNVEILLRHRAVLFGILGVFLIVSVFKPTWQLAAITTGIVSTLSFLALTWGIGELNSEMSRVVMVDTVAVVLLLAAAIMFFIGTE